MHLGDFEVPNTIQLRVVSFGFSAWLQEVVARMDIRTREVGAPCGERQLEQRRLERERQCSGRQLLERRQSGFFSLLLAFSRHTCGSFIFYAFFPAVEHPPYFFRILDETGILFCC